MTPATIVAEGWHHGAGTDHAEVDALSKIDGRPRPHRRRHPRAVQPPRAHRTVQRGASQRRASRRVVYAISDPGHRSAGGAAHLRGGRRRGHLRRARRRGRSARATAGSPRSAAAGPGSPSSGPPRLDGRAAASDGSSKWITGTAARQRVHEQRAAERRDPRRHGNRARRRPVAHRPRRRRRVPAAPAAAGRRRRAGGARGCRAAPSSGRLRRDPQSRPRRDPRRAGRARHLRRVYVEGGPTLASAVVAAGFADEYAIYLAPALLGGGARATISRSATSASRPSATVRRLAHRLRRAARRRPAHPRNALVPKKKADMFTGIIEELGTVLAWNRSGDAARLTVRAPLAASDAEARRLDLGRRRLPHRRRSGLGLVQAESWPRRSRASTLGRHRSRRRVNIERADRVGDRLGGHIVQGHIDGTAEVLAIVEGGAWRVVRIALAPRARPARRPQGLDRGRRRLAHRQRRERPDRADGLVRGLAHPRDARRHHPRRPRRRRPRQHRDRHPGPPRAAPPRLRPKPQTTRRSSS